MWRVPVVVVVGADVVLGESDGPRPDVDVGQHRHVMVRGLRDVDAGLGAERLAERDRDAGLDEPGRGGDPSRREVVQGPSPSVVVPAAPVGDGVEELAELRLRHVHGGHGATLGRLHPRPNHLIRVMPPPPRARKIGGESSSSSRRKGPPHEHRGSTPDAVHRKRPRNGRRAARRRVRGLRHHRRPGQGDDVPGAVPAGAPRPARLPDPGSGGRRLDDRPAARARQEMHRGHRRVDRRRDLQSLCRATLVRVRRLRRRLHLRAGRERTERRSQPGLLSGDPAVALRDGDRGAGPGGSDSVSARGRREAVRARRRLGACSQRGGPPAPGRVPALPDRPLPGLQGAGRDPIPPVREHDVRADLESQLHLVRAAHDGRDLRRGRSRPFLRSRRGAARRGREPPDAGRGHHRDGAAGGRDPSTLGERDGLGLPGHSRRRPGALRARSARRLPRDRGRGCRLDDGDLRGAAAARRQLALVRSAVLHPHGQEPAAPP